MSCREIILKLFQRKIFPDNMKNSIFGLLQGKKIILYGAGNGFVTFFVFILKKYGLKVHAVIDCKFKSDETYYGIPAFAPLEYKPTREETETAVVVVTVGKSEFYQEIFNYLHNLKFQNILLASEIYEYHLCQTPPALKEKGFRYYLEHKEQIMSCLELFTDDLSREVYTSFLQTHMLRKPIPIPARDLEEQYFPKDIKLSKGYSRFINCGAYTGDTVMQLNLLFGKADTIACFEPEIKNFELLISHLCSNYKEIAHNIIAFPCGVFSHEIQLPFLGGNQHNSTISNEGESFIQCVALDHVLPGFKPTFINMDIEGAELEALIGAEMLIKENKPDLAICLYHSPNHLWDIPLYLQGLNLGYRFFIRNYTSFTSETVLYATT